MSNTFDFVMTEHPAWLPTPAGRQRVFTMHDGTRSLVTTHAGHLTVVQLHGGTTTPRADVFSFPEGLLDHTPELATAVRTLGRVTRFRNENLWDAIATAIIRQVIRAGQSKKLYRAFCEAYGERIELPNGVIYPLFPASETVLRLNDAAFSAIGMAFKRQPLRAAAEAFLELGGEWRQMPPAILVNELQRIRRVGAWTAGAATADWSNNWALYPYSDLAVRTWARRAAPSFSWPTDEPAFGYVWRALAGDDLSPLTLLTLAWGSQHGDIG